MHDDEITRLALEAGRGDGAATTEFVRATQADVWRYVAYLVDRAQADDLTQETYLRALRGLRTFRGDTAARVWLLSIARRAVVDHFRKQGRRPAVGASLDDLDTATDRIVPTSPEASGEISLQMLIEELDEDKRNAFVLTQVHGLSYQEAAEVCGVPIGTIRSRMARAREQLLGDLAEAETAGGEDAPRRHLRRL
ncbi:MAG: sigma-70 family RNA polymerase sigma factor [Sporichthyaceae bacterium]